ncbi:MAG TPA: peptide deformylase [Acidobacteriota bacterium]
MILKVARMGHPVLRRRAEAVGAGRLLEPEFQRFLDDLIETMHEYEGVGLAAPQVHVAARVCAIAALGTEDAATPLRILVNPAIVDRSGATASDWEGCLSIPELRGQVPRATHITVEALDRAGRPLQFEAADFAARVIQHEVDHLDGILFLDRMTDLRSLAFLHEFERFQLAADRATALKVGELPHTPSKVGELPHTPWKVGELPHTS